MITPSADGRPVRVARFVLGILTGYVALAVAMTLTKRPWVDEAYFAIPALNLLTRGVMATTNLETTGTWLVGVDQYTYWVMPLHLVTQAGWYWVFGFGVLSLRTLSIVWGAVALVAIFVTVDRLTQQRRAALLAMAIVATDYTFIRAAGDGRMDMMNAALGFAGLASYLTLRSRGLTPAILVSHSCTMASFLTHPNGLMPILALAGLTLFLDRSRLGWRHVLLAAAPYVVGVLAWGGYILQAPHLFLAQFGGNAAGDPWEGIGSWFGSVWHAYAGAYGLQTHWAGPAVHLRAFVLLAYLAGVAAVLATPPLRRDRGVRGLLLILGTYFLLMSFMRRASAHDYIIHVAPLYASLLAVWVTWAWQQARLPRLVLAGAVASLLVLQVGGVALRAYVNNYDRHYRPLVRFLQTESRPDDLIIGGADLGFALGFTPRLVDDTRLGFYSGRHAEFIVVDNRYQTWFEGYLDREPAVQAYVRTLLAEQYEPVYAQNTDMVFRCRQHRSPVPGDAARAQASREGLDAGQ